MQDRPTQSRQERRIAERAAAKIPSPPPETQARIAEAVHRSMVEGFGDEAAMACTGYAIVGAAVASEVVGRPYWPQFGTLVALCSAAADQPDDLPFYLCFKADDPKTRGLEFHAWFESPAEVVDLAARHYRWNAERMGLPWTVADPPSFVWARRGKLPPTLRLTAVPGLDGEALTALSAARLRMLADAIRRALKDL